MSYKAKIINLIKNHNQELAAQLLKGAGIDAAKLLLNSKAFNTDDLMCLIQAKDIALHPTFIKKEGHKYDWNENNEIEIIVSEENTPYKRVSIAIYTAKNMASFELLLNDQDRTTNQYLLELNNNKAKTEALIRDIELCIFNILQSYFSRKITDYKPVIIKKTLNLLAENLEQKSNLKATYNKLNHTIAITCKEETTEIDLGNEYLFAKDLVKYINKKNREYNLNCMKNTYSNSWGKITIRDNDFKTNILISEDILKNKYP